MPPPPHIAYLIAAYNAEKTIGPTLASILAQCTPWWQAVVVDDGSTDGTAAEVERLARNDEHGRIRLVRQRNGGPGLARQAAFAASTAPVVCFFDADDLAEPEHAEALLGAMGERQAVACGYRVIDHDGTDLRWEHLPSDADFSLDAQLRANRVGPGCGAVRRSALERVMKKQGWLFDRFCKCEDWDFWLRLAHCWADDSSLWAPPVKRALVLYRQAQATRSKDILGNYNDGRRAITRFARSIDQAESAVHALTLRALGQAISQQDRCAAEFLAGLLRRGDSWTPRAADEAVLGSAIRWSLLATDRGAVVEGRLKVREVEARIRGMLPGYPQPTGLARIAMLDDRAWQVIARTAAGMVGQGERIVIYGMGKNGRAFLRAIAQRRTPDAYWLGFIDENPDAGAGDLAGGSIARLSVDQLAQSDLVVVTPDQHSSIVDKLQRSAARSVKTANELWASD